MNNFNDSDLEDYLFMDDSSSEYEEYLSDSVPIAISAAMFLCEDNSRGGSVEGREVIHRDRAYGELRLNADYFDESCIFNDKMFRRRFRMQRTLFNRIVNEIEEKCQYFTQRTNAMGELGFSARHKATAAMRLLAYGTTADSVDEYLRMSETTAMETLKEFCKAIIKCYEKEYLRKPNAQDLERILDVGRARGFPGMLGSLDCMHWEWKNCPTAWQGQYIGKEKRATLILEAVATQDLWIWHAFFGLPGALNDINVFDRSSLFKEYQEGSSPDVEYEVNGKSYSLGYFLADGIYPSYAALVKTFSTPRTEKEKFFAKMQEAARKDIERAFGVLQARFAILVKPARLWNYNDLEMIMKACIIIHSMIVEDERGEDELGYNYEQPSGLTPTSFNNTSDNRINFEDFVRRYGSIRDTEKHFELRANLVEHIWRKFKRQES